MGTNVQSADPDQSRPGKEQGVAGAVASCGHDGGRAEGGESVTAREAAGLGLADWNATLSQLNPVDVGTRADRRPP